MDIKQHIITDRTLKRMTDSEMETYLCHAYCYAGHCTFELSERAFHFGAGDCMIVPRRGDLLGNICESPDFEADFIYITQEFIQISTPQSNYGVKGHLSLFENPVMHLTSEQQRICAFNFDYIKRRLTRPEHNFYREVLINAVQCMILDFFDFHTTLFGQNRISAQNHQLMQQFIEMLEQGHYRRNRDIGYYADKLCVTAKHLSEVSKKVSGQPANYWITRYASLDISRRLRDRSLSFTQISELFGFTSLSHFSRYVQKNLGCKPSDFRE